MYIAVDLGAESGRVIVGDLTQLEVMHRFSSRSARLHGTLFWDAPGIFSEILRGLRASFNKFGEKITSIGIDTWGVDYGLLDASGQLLGNPFHYRDSRTDGIMEQVKSDIGAAEIYSATGIQFLPFNTVYQLAEEVRNRSERLNAARDFLTIPDLLNYWLCGVKANEFTNATTTGLYNPRTGDWAWGLINKIGIPHRIFRDVISPGTILGELNEQVRLAISAPLGIKVVAPACHDTGSAVAAMPLTEGEPRNYAYLSSGTWSLLGVELDQPLINEGSLRANFTNEGGVGGKFRFLKNIMGLWILQECRKEWISTDGMPFDYAEIVRLAIESGPAQACIDIDDSRFLKPGVPGDGMVSRILDYCEDTGQNTEGSPGGIARLIIESLAKRYAENLSVLSKLTGKVIESLYIIGGGCQNELLNSLTAEIAQVRVNAGPVEATALGNMLMQALANREIGSIAEGRRIIRQHHEVATYS